MGETDITLGMIKRFIIKYRLDLLFLWLLGVITGAAFLFAYNCYCSLISSDSVVLNFR